MDAHERYQALAVEHVFGGLISPDADRFRAHLIGCCDSALRVAELRGIAADLAVAEREERAEVRVRTEAARRADDTGEDVAAARRRVPTADAHGLTIALVIGALGVLISWNLHLRAQIAEAQTPVERLETAWPRSRPASRSWSTPPRRPADWSFSMTSRWRSRSWTYRRWNTPGCTRATSCGSSGLPTRGPRRFSRWRATDADSPVLSSTVARHSCG